MKDKRKGKKDEHLRKSGYSDDELWHEPNKSRRDRKERDRRTHERDERKEKRWK